MTWHGCILHGSKVAHTGYSDALAVQSASAAGGLKLAQLAPDRRITIGGVKYHMRQRVHEQDADVGTGGAVWAGGVAMAQALHSEWPTGHWRGRRVLELGCGPGLVAAVLQHLGADVYATDARPEAAE